MCSVQVQGISDANAPALFVDTDLNVRFFTPAAQRLFDIPSGKTVRALSDLTPLSTDEDLVSIVQQVLRHLRPDEREISAADGVWFLRQIQPYLSEIGGLAGAAISYVDITDQKQAQTSLTELAITSRRASLAKSRFLAEACHELRQPLQSLSLIHQLLERQKPTGEVGKLAGLMGQCLSSMTTMLDSMLDTSRIESGIVQPKIEHVSVEPLFDKLVGEFRQLCDLKGLSLQSVPVAARIRTDRQLLEQALRNLVSNVVENSANGTIVLGCRRQGKRASILVSNTGARMEELDMEALFDTFSHGVKARDLAGHRGGLELSIVQRIGKLLDHPISVKANPGRGSSFLITAPIAKEPQPDAASDAGDRQPPRAVETGCILIVEEDAMLRDLLAGILRKEGHAAIVKANANDAIAWASAAVVAPDLVLLAYDLRHDLTGIKLAEDLAEILGQNIPALILTGDVSAKTSEAIARANFHRVVKPVDGASLLAKVAELIVSAKALNARLAPSTDIVASTVHVIDDDPIIRQTTRHLLEKAGLLVMLYGSAEDFLAAPRPTGSTCLLVDQGLPGISGLEMISILRAENLKFGIVFLTGQGDAAKAVAAMKAGASDFLEKPARPEQILTSVQAALHAVSADAQKAQLRKTALQRLSDLTEREREVLERVLDGQPNKIIAAELGLNQRTVEHHRAAVMKKTGAPSLPDLVRLAIAAELRNR